MAGEDRNYLRINAVEQAQNWRPPSGVAEDRNPYRRVFSAAAVSSRPPFAVAEDRNDYVYPLPHNRERAVLRKRRCPESVRERSFALLCLICGVRMRSLIKGHRKALHGS
jgi:hypothetical protein